MKGQPGKIGRINPRIAMIRQARPSKRRASRRSGEVLARLDVIGLLTDGMSRIGGAYG
jgi:hypothetical protein